MYLLYSQFGHCLQTIDTILPFLAVFFTEENKHENIYLCTPSLIPYFINLTKWGGNPPLQFWWKIRLCCTYFACRLSFCSLCLFCFTVAILLCREICSESTLFYSTDVHIGCAQDEEMAVSQRQDRIWETELTYGRWWNDIFQKFWIYLMLVYLLQVQTSQKQTNHIYNQ